MKRDSLVLRAARRGGGWAAVLALARLADVAVSVLFPLALAHAIDTVLAGRDVLPALLPCAALFALSAAAGALLELGAGSAAARATAWVRHLLVGRLLAAGPARGALPAGEAASRITAGAADAGTAPVAAIQSGIALLQPVGAMVALIVIDWRVALGLALGLPVIAVLLRAFVRDVSGSVRRYMTVQGTIAARLGEALGGARTIAAAGTSAREADRVLTALPELRDHGHALWRAQGGMGGRGLVVGLLLQVCALAVAGFQLAAGRITPGELVAVAQYAGLVVGLGPIVSGLLRLARARAGAGWAAELLAAPVPEHGTRDAPPGPGRLEFRGVRSGGVLDGLDLVVPGGRSVAVVGRSGAGKSLLAALAGRLADPDAGEVLLDGVPLPELSRPALRREVGYAFDRPALFGATVRDAIGFGPEPATPARVLAAASAARADDFVRRLPAGYATPVTDAPMSGGELQRLGLARAFAHPGRLLVLDDATSSLDTATELQVAQALAGEFGDRTRLIIAHRAGTAARADLVAWLDGGRIRALGRHADLWADPGYRDVFGADGR
ncbi:ABC transporter ATP-binding protein [Actinomadura craniellae]|uniref:ABC transporter ATP-binding protein n=1 Tax=Actinomadura craniellae TaxID=2231787 RepID=UPI0018F20552|nr:ABC transporter ATP-binding protein [Actinomadura craniellae]